MENKNLQAELDWVDKHPQFYIDDVHREDVKLNLTLGYEIRELEGKLNTAPIHERAALELRISELKDSRRYNRKVEYVSIKCPPTPNLDAELDRTAQLKAKYGDKWYLYVVPGQVKNTGIQNRVACTGMVDSSVDNCEHWKGLGPQ